MLTRTFTGLLLLLVLALPMPVAQAASFDCVKAETAFERAICSDPELSRNDETLAKAYATATGGLSSTARTVVQDGQRQWLAFAERACTEDAQPLQGEYDADGLACLNQIFSTRISHLEGSRMQSGRRFYPADSYEVMVDAETEGEVWNKVATKEFSSPRIDAEDAEAAAFNTLMENHDAGLSQSMGGGEGDVADISSPTVDNSSMLSVDNVSSRRISLVANDWWYGHGGAHGNYTIAYRHFLVPEARELVAGDIFAADGWERALADLALAELNRTIEGGIWPEAEELVAEVVSEPGRWNFSEAGLILQFQPYEVTAYAFGAPTVTIPWHALDPYLAENGLEIATY